MDIAVIPNETRLGAYLKRRRTALDPAALGLTSTRRRTPGLRREEVAQRASISTTWYTWLEQGRGGAPSAAVLDRIATALLLTDAEREHAFLLGLGRPPDVRYQAAAAVSPRLQRVLDAFEYSPAIVRTMMWDVVAWNRAAARLLTDYSLLPPAQRNIVRLIFTNPHTRARQVDWEAVARFVVAVFRADAARLGSTPAVDAFVDEMRRTSPEFEAFWRDSTVRNWGEGVKQLRHGDGVLSFDYSAFTVDGRPDLGMIVYNPATPADTQRIRALLALET
ncbi:helix-turn-helix protein [Pseudoduganella lurida]|uniref:Helix-turn-helix protein n=1 Tax=Pseudoduganella lurida TaxID=1036180 RepID=A0A562R609_9BURK|nr:helix-turn-helix transcriptional regulator [Pseudoduganella lurida]TWI64501.1 helix-turn-helix protein [Pseudoduganella lurida]